MPLSLYERRGLETLPRPPPALQTITAQAFLRNPQVSTGGDFYFPDNKTGRRHLHGAVSIFTIEIECSRLSCRLHSSG
jgi:hypothetical protein